MDNSIKIKLNLYEEKFNSFKERYSGLRSKYIELSKGEGSYPILTNKIRNLGKDLVTVRNKIKSIKGNRNLEKETESVHKLSEMLDPLKEKFTSIEAMYYNFDHPDEFEFGED